MTHCLLLHQQLRPWSKPKCWLVVKSVFYFTLKFYHKLEESQLSPLCYILFCKSAMHNEDSVHNYWGLKSTSQILL